MREVVLNPEPESTGVRIPLSAKIELGQVTSLSNAANPITFDIRPALLSYAAKRQTFERIVEDGGDVTLKVSSNFEFGSDSSFHYTFKLKGQLIAGGRSIGRYSSESTTRGGMVRLTAAADQGPTSEAFRQALDRLFGAIEADRLQILANLAGEKGPASTAASPAIVPASDVDFPAYRNEENPNDFALVIGIEKYENLPAADFAEHDASAMRRHLLALGYPERNIIYLVGAKASKTGIEKYLETWLPLNVNQNSRVFVYFSGHGAPDPATGQAYLVPWDGDAKFLKNTGYPVKQLYKNLEALKAKEVVVAMDSCFSGEGGRSVLAKGARPLVTNVDTGVDAGGKLAVFAASAGDEITGTDDGQGHGLFTYQFLKGLTEKKGATTVQELFAYLRPKVQDAARRDGREQSPQLMPAGLFNAPPRDIR